MSTESIQNSIIRKVLNSNDDQLLNYLNQLLSAVEGNEQYVLSAFEERIISESQDDYKSGKVISNETILTRNETWLEE